MSQGPAGQPVPPRGCRPSPGMPSELPDGQDVRNGVRARAPRGNAASPGPSPRRAPRSGAGWCAGKPPPCSSASSLPFPRVDCRRSGLDGEDARVTCGRHVQMSIGTCLAPCSRAGHPPSCATRASAVGSSSPVLSPETRDTVSLPPACSCLIGQHGLRLRASGTALPVPL